LAFSPRDKAEEGYVLHISVLYGTLTQNTMFVHIYVQTTVINFHSCTVHLDVIKAFYLHHRTKQNDVF